MRHKTFTASRLVFVTCTNLDACLGLDRPLRVIRSAAAFDTDRVRFRNEFSNRQQLRHRLERLAGIVLIQPCYDNATAFTSKCIYGVDDLHIKELPLVDDNYLHVDLDDTKYHRVMRFL